MKLNEITKEQLIHLQQSKKIYLEGNILKILEDDGDVVFQKYIKDSIEKDINTRKKRLEITKQIQKQNKELTDWKIENERIQEELLKTLEENKIVMVEYQKAKEDAELSKDQAEKSMIEAVNAKSEAEHAKETAENDLELIQKKTQFELIGNIVKISLVIICSVGLITTIMYGFSIMSNSSETHVIGTAWSNMLGILLTNAFSIVGTIMGVKYASEKNT